MLITTTEAIFGGGSSSDSRLNRLFPSLANLRSKSRSPNGSERDNGSDHGVSPAVATTPKSPTLLTVPDDSSRQHLTLSPLPGTHATYIDAIDDIEVDKDEDELNKAIEESLAGSSTFGGGAVGARGGLGARSYFGQHHARNASVNSTNRYTARGTDLVEMERALALSLLEGGYQPNYIDDTGHEGASGAGGFGEGVVV